MVQRNALTLIAIVLIGIMLVGPSLMSGLGDLGKDLGDWVKHGWDFDTDDLLDVDGVNGNGDNGDAEGTEGTAILNAIVQFKDGTQHTVTQQELTFTLFPLTVFFEGKEVDRILWTLGAEITWEGEITGLRVSGELGCYYEEQIIKSQDFQVDYSPTVLEKNEWFAVKELLVTEQDIDAVIPAGTSTLRVTTRQLTFQATFQSGHEETHTLGEGYAPVWDMEVTKSADALTILSANLQAGIYFNP